MSERRAFIGVIKLGEADKQCLSLQAKEVRRRFPVELWLLNDLVNENGWRYERIVENKNGFLEMPILTAYLNGGRTIGDGHNFQEETDADGNPAPSFTRATDERIVGVMSARPDDIRAERADSTTWIVGKGFIYSWYAKELVNKIGRYTEQGRDIPISIETLVTQSRMDGEVEVEEEYEILGVTILGDHVAPAVTGARISALSISESEYREMKVRAASLLKQDNEHNESEEVKTLEIFTKKMCEKLQPKFTEHRVLAAVRSDDGVIHVALCGKDYTMARYDMGSENDTVVPANIVACQAMADFGIGEGVDLSSTFDELTAEVARLNTALEAANKTITERDNQITAMREAENKRRVNAAKAVAKATLAAFNANRTEKIADNEIDQICADIDKGCYTAMVNEDGEWCGDAAVEEKVYAKCARKVQEADAEAAKKAKTTYTYDQIQNGEKSGESGITKLLRDRGILD